MAQVTWRASDELVARVRRVAAEQGRSMNDLLTQVLEAATNPEHAGTEAERLRERLTHAGILASGGPVHPRPAPTAVAQARRAAGRGTPLSEIVARERR
jgi:hypothetical protein